MKIAMRLEARTGRQTCESSEESALCVLIIANRSFYDITAPASEAFPPKWNIEWLNNATVQDAVGSPVNFTENDYYVFNAFAESMSFLPPPRIFQLITFCVLHSW